MNWLLDLDWLIGWLVEQETHQSVGKSSKIKSSSLTKNALNFHFWMGFFRWVGNKQPTTSRWCFPLNKSLKFLRPSVGVSGCQVGWSRRSPGWPCATHGRCGEFGLGVWGPGSRRDHPMVGGERWREGVVSLLSLVVMYRYIVYCSYQGSFKILFILFLSWLSVWWGSDESLWGSVAFGFGGSRGLWLTGISSQEEDDCGDNCAGTEISEISKIGGIPVGPVDSRILEEDS